MSFVSDLCSVAREPHFGRLYATRLTSQGADGVFQVALASFVFFSPEKQTTAARVAAAFATLLLPYSLVGPFAGVLLDRWRRQRVLVLANVVRAAMVVGVAALVATGVDGPAFFASALAVLSVNRFFLAALSAALPHVVTRDELVMANSVSTTSGTLAALLGGGIGFLVRRLAGDGDSVSAVVMLVAAGAYLVAASIATRFRADLLGPDVDPTRPQAREALHHVVRGLRDGAAHVRRNRRARRALGAITAHRFCYGIALIATILLYRNYFHTTTDLEAGLGGLALVFAASAAGILVGAVITPEVTALVTKETCIALSLGLAAAAQLALGLPFTEPTVVAAAFLLGVVAQGAKVCVDSLLQESVDDAYRGRVFSFYDLLFNVAFVAAAAVAAVALPASGRSSAAVVVIALGYAVTAAGYAWASSRRPDDRREPERVHGRLVG